MIRLLMIKGDINHHFQVSNQYVPIMAEKTSKIWDHLESSAVFFQGT